MAREPYKLTREQEKALRFSLEDLDLLIWDARNVSDAKKLKDY